MQAVSPVMRQTVTQTARMTGKHRSPGRGRSTAVALFALAAFGLTGIYGPPVMAQDRPDALVLYRQGQFQQAVTITLQELEENPSNLDAYTVLGWSLLALNRLDDALEYGRRGMQVSRFDHRIVHILGETNYRLGNYLEALQFFQDYAALAPAGRQIDQVYYLMGEIFIRFEEYNHADIALTTAMTLNDTRPAWWARLGYAREMAGDTEGARTAYREALERNPNLPEARSGLDRVSASN